MVGEKIKQRWYNFYTKKSGKDWAAVCPSPLLREVTAEVEEGRRKGRQLQGLEVRLRRGIS